MKNYLYYILRCTGQQWAWSVWDGEQFLPSSPPVDHNKAPVLALLPDELFFYLSPPKGVVQGRAALVAARMAMRHSFPALSPTQQSGIVQIAPDEAVAFCSHPKLDVFLKEHGAALDQATFLTTEFILAKAAARAAHLETWVWVSDDSPHALVSQDELHYFRSGEGELQARLLTQKLDNPPPRLHLEKIFEILADHDSRLEHLRIAVKGVSAEWGAASQLTRKVALLAAIIGVLFCLGQGLRFFAVRASAEALGQSMSAQYMSVLGQELGDDPYGRLLSRLEKVRRGADSGLDALDLLDQISHSAPQGLVLDGFTLTIGGGTLKGQAASYENLEELLRGLSSSQRFIFTLDKAATVGKSVEFSLSVKTK